MSGWVLMFNILRTSRATPGPDPVMLVAVLPLVEELVPQWTLVARLVLVRPLV